MSGKWPIVTVTQRLASKNEQIKAQMHKEDDVSQILETCTMYQEK